MAAAAEVVVVVVVVVVMRAQAAESQRTAARCAVCKYGCIDAIHHTLDHRLGAFIVHLILAAVLVEHDVECKAQVSVAMAAADVQALGRLRRGVERDEGVADCAGYNRVRFDVLSFFGIKRPYANSHKKVGVLPVRHFHLHLPITVPVCQHPTLPPLHQRR